MQILHVCSCFFFQGLSDSVESVQTEVKSAMTDIESISLAKNAQNQVREIVFVQSFFLVLQCNFFDFAVLWISCHRELSSNKSVPKGACSNAIQHLEVVLFLMTRMMMKMKMRRMKNRNVCTG